MPKKNTYLLEDRKRFIEETFKIEPKFLCNYTYEGLTTEQKLKADFILRGLRNPADFI
jgi:pantetheine-phosphate adenylyltransferase